MRSGVEVHQTDCQGRTVCVDCAEHHESHEYGPVVRARFTGNPHRKCLHCGHITMDLEDSHA